MTARLRPHRLAGAVLVLGLLLGACTSAPLAVPDGPTVDVVSLPSSAPRPGTPTGEVTVAYPVPPATFLPDVGDEPAADDLAAIWGLPLFRVGPDGRLRPGLVVDWEVRGATTDGWEVVLRLRPGRWSDGTAVVARDVVATLRRRMRTDPVRFARLAQVTAPARDRVRLVLAGPDAGWSDLMLEAGPVLPADAVEQAATAFAHDVPVSGGPFRLASRDPGRRLVFEAHPDGPLGPPHLARVVVLFVPSYETALGLLEQGEVDSVVGHLALNPVARAEEVEGVTAAAPLGGTTVGVQFRHAGALGGHDRAPARRGVLGALDVEELVEGLLGPFGQVASSPWPGVRVPASVPDGAVPGGTTLTLLHPQEAEALGFTVRALQRDLRQREVTVELVPETRPAFTRIARESYDASLQVRRTGPRPSLASWAEDPASGRAASAAGPGTPTARDGLAAVASTARLGPLYRIGVAHAWRGVAGLRPSSWLGAGFWNVGEWRRES